MPYISNLSEIKDVAIVDVVAALGHKIDRTHKVASPFKEEKTPSCHIYNTSNTFYCFSSGEGGDAIKYYMLSKNCDFQEAAEQVAKIGAVAVVYSETETKNEPDNTVLYSILEQATIHYQSCLVANKNALNYLSARGYKPDTITAFRCGYSDGTIKEHLLKIGFNIADIKQVLLNENENDTFYKRVVFPIQDQRGRIVGFTARAIDSQLPKYINSPETKIYSKRNHLFGFWTAKKIKGNTCYLVEGCTDVITLWQAGLAAAASLGTALSETQIKLLSKFNSIVIWRDGDDAGVNSALKDVEKLVKNEIYPKIAKTQSNDPDEYVRKNGVNIETSDAIMFYASSKLFEKDGKPIEKDEATNEIAKLLYSIPSGSLREVFARDICKNFKINPKIFFGKLREQKPQTDTERHQRSIADAQNYMRIGIKFFKKIVTANPRYNTTQLEYAKWEQSLIKEDYKMFPSFIDHIAKYDGFTVVPNYQNYKESIEVIEPLYKIYSKLYNLTKPLPFVPKKGEFPTIQAFITHIFANEKSDWNNDRIGDPLTIIKDCYRIKLQKPMEMLPVICLVSKEQESGKSTILKFNKDLFGDNAVIIGNEHLKVNFNTTYADKQVVGIDENFVTIEEKTIKEKIKKLATDDEILYHPKGIDPSPLSWFGWLFLCSNDENDFMPLETSDRRFWVIKVKTPTQRDPDLRKKMMEEIPAFLYYMFNTEIHHPKKTRMWFETNHIITEQMLKIASRTRPYLDALITDYIKSIFLTYPNVTEFSIPLKELVSTLNQTAKYEVTATKVANWLEDIKGIKPGRQTQHCKWVIGWNDETADPTTSNINWIRKLGKPLTFLYHEWVTEADFDNADDVERHLELVKYLENYYNVPF